MFIKDQSNKRWLFSNNQHVNAFYMLKLLLFVFTTARNASKATFSMSMLLMPLRPHYSHSRVFVSASFIISILHRNIQCCIIHKEIF